MVIQQIGQAGTLESSDVMVTIAPAAAGSGIMLELTSIVLKQYGKQIRAVANEVMQASGVADAEVRINDRGALDCTLRARLTTALRRSQTGA